MAKTPRGKILEAQYDKGTLADRVGELEADNTVLQQQVLEATKFYNPLVSGLIGNCVVCGEHPVPFDYSISDELWQKVVPKELSPNVICLSCFEEMGDGIPENDWIILYYTGKAGTVAFIPIRTLVDGN